MVRVRLARISLTLTVAALALPVFSTWVHADPQRLDRRVLASFREVVAQPAKSTVQIYCDGYRAALGAVVREDGYIVTKSSELKGKIECLLPGRRQDQKLEATIVASDAALDLTILKIDAKDLTPIVWAESAPPVGSWLVTPGLDPDNDPVSIGVVSVAARKISAPEGALGITVPGEGRGSEARIEDIVPGNAADKAGLKVGDIILKINGKEITDKDHLVKTIKSYMPGEKVELLVKRGSDELKLTATLGSRMQLFHGDRADFQNSLGGPLSERRAGFAMAIQHDSVLRPVDCGGPIVDLDGKAIGLNIARAGRVESYALPAALVRESVDKLLQTHLTSAPAAEKPAEAAPAKPTER
jgi:serine protease Do